MNWFTKPTQSDTIIHVNNHIIKREEIIKNNINEIAIRSILPAIVAIIFWITTVFLILYARFTPRLFEIDRMLFYALWLIPIMTLVFALYYTKCIITIPKVIIKYHNGILYLYPSRFRHIAVSPRDIVFISHEIYRRGIRYYINGLGGNYSSGKMTIETTSAIINLNWVKNVDEVHRELKSLLRRY